MTDAEKAAYQAVIELRRKYNLGFLQNPGGGEFSITSGKNAGFRCQVSLYSPIDDLAKLTSALQDAGIMTTTLESD